MAPFSISLSLLNMKAHNIEILLVEDNPGDVRLTQEALRESSVRNHLNVVGDGASALAYLAREAPFTNAAAPDLILLDLNLPRVNGREVLDHIKQHPTWKVIPVIVLTTSRSQRDIQDSYDRHVNSYVTKPLSFEPFMEMMRIIEKFWLGTVSLPKPN